MKRSVITLSAMSLLLLSSTSMAASIEKVPRENGAVHEEFKSILKRTISQFRSGVGRIQIPGKSKQNRACLVNFYTTGETTFVTLDVEDENFYNEFYVDHPHENFKQILFQNVIKNDDSVELKVVQRDGGYSFSSDGKYLTVTSTKPNEKSESCKFTLSKAELYEGETE